MTREGGNYKRRGGPLLFAEDSGVILARMAPRRALLSLRAVLLLALLMNALSPAAQSQSGGAPTSQGVVPGSANWGADARQRLQAIFNLLLQKSGYDLPSSLARDRRAPTQLVFAENEPADSHPARSMAAPFNDKDHSEVFVNQHIFEVCRNDDQLAFALSHEIGHLVKEHMKAMDRFSDDLEKTKMPAWVAGDGRAAYDACLRTGMKPQCDIGARNAFVQAHETELETFARELERQADGEAVALMGLGGYDPSAGPQVVLSLAQWRGAEGLPERADEIHDAPEDRARRVQSWVDAVLASVRRP